jgi:radical SAM superfamily enzyme YgiQ (UPF0313 family)
MTAVPFGFFPSAFPKLFERRPNSRFDGPSDAVSPEFYGSFVPHVAFVPFTGFRVREAEMLALGMTLPGLGPRSRAIAELPALGLLTLAGATPEDWTCSYRAAEAVTDELLEVVLAESPQLVAVSALTASIDEAYDFARRVVKRGVPVVMGGLHVTACPEEAARHCSAVVVGPGEGVWPQLLADCAAGHLAPMYRARAAEAPAWPTPRFDLLGSRLPRIMLQTQRGCPLACEFCGASRLLGAFREKPLERIEHELAAICARHRKPLIELADDNTFAGSRDAGPLLDLLARSRARWMTESDWRLGERPEIVGRLAAAGCVQVLVGIESLVFRYPGLGHKQAELERVLAAVQAIQAAGVAVNACFIVGADGETRQSLERLTRFILDAPLAEVQLTVQTPFPGTPLRRRLAREGRLLDDRGWDACTLFDVAFRPDRMSVAELERGFREAVTAVFCREASAKREAIRRDIWRHQARLVL